MLVILQATPRGLVKGLDKKWDNAQCNGTQQQLFDMLRRSNLLIHS
jgi:hypothetical protein